MTKQTIATAKTNHQANHLLYPITIFLCVVAITVFLTISFTATSFGDVAQPAADVSAVKATVAVTNQGTLENEGHGVMWRYTNEGWRNIAPLIVQPEPSPSPIRKIHPFVWAATILLASLSLTVWASSEWDMSRLLDK